MAEEEKNADENRFEGLNPVPVNSFDEVDSGRPDNRVESRPVADDGLQSLISADEFNSDILTANKAYF